jgi:glycosyltransferase involved in cell wall biosynthesis
MNTCHPKVTVVIPAYNAEETIDQCLNALKDQTVSSEIYEIIFVDDGSTDSTNQKVEYHQAVRLYSQANKGPAMARNYGAERARGEILLFIDSDCVPKKDWIEHMISPFSQGDIVGVKGAYINNQQSLVARFVQLEYEDRYDHMMRRKYIDFIDTYSAGYRRDVFITNGGFDKIFSTSSVEDQEFSFRLAKQGLKMVFAPEAKVYHLGHSNSLISYFRKKYKIGYWKVLVHQQHPDKLISDSHTPQILKLQIIMVGLGVILLIFGFINPIFIRLDILVLFAFLLSTIPFISKAWTKDKAVAIIAPFLLLSRAFALGFGLCAGIVKNRRIRLGTN